MISTGGNVTAQGSRLQALGACGRWPRRAPTVAPPYHPKSAATGARKELSLREMTFSETRRGVMRHGSREEKLESTGTARRRQALRSHLCPCSNANAISPYCTSTGRVGGRNMAVVAPEEHVQVEAIYRISLS